MNPKLQPWEFITRWGIPFLEGSAIQAIVLSKETGVKSLREAERMFTHIITAEKEGRYTSPDELPDDDSLTDFCLGWDLSPFQFEQVAVLVNWQTRPELAAAQSALREMILCESEQERLDTLANDRARGAVVHRPVLVKYTGEWRFPE
jgi:hypothetical protein